jgi:hypothetical protein
LTMFGGAFRVTCCRALITFGHTGTREQSATHDE